MSNQLVYGSLRDISIRSGKGLAEAFMDIDALVAGDTSGSMDLHDCPRGRRRFDLACEQLIRLQREIPGKIGLVSWNDSAKFCSGGILTAPDGGTDMVRLLEFIKPADGLGIRIIIISDGEPDNPDKTLDLAKTFKSKIDTIYCGPESGYGREFLKRLSELTGGQAVSQSVNQLGQLKETVQKLITA